MPSPNSKNKICSVYLNKNWQKICKTAENEGIFVFDFVKAL